MSLQTWRETLINSQVDGAALNTSTTATSLLIGQSKLTLPSGFFSQIGKALKIRAQGRISTFTSGTLTLDVRMGPTANIIVFTSSALVMTASLTNLTFDLEIELVARAIGSGTTANLMGIGRLLCAATNPVGVTMLPLSAPAVGTGFDSTVTMLVDLFGTWSVSNAANSIQVHSYSIESLN